MSNKRKMSRQKRYTGMSLYTSKYDVGFKTVPDDSFFGF